jgi:hypothetical protein
MPVIDTDTLARQVVWDDEAKLAISYRLIRNGIAQGKRFSR